MTESCIAGRSTPFGLRLCIACLGLVAILGCDTAGDRRAISGSVTIDGKPIPVGTVLLLPDAGHRGPSASGSIVEGEYQFTTENGPTAGQHRVIISISGPLVPFEVAAKNEPAKDMASPENSSVAKQGPAGSRALAKESQEPKASGEKRTQWETKTTVLASDAPNAAKPIDFAFQSNGDDLPPETDTTP